MVVNIIVIQAGIKQADICELIAAGCGIGECVVQHMVLVPCLRTAFRCHPLITPEAPIGSPCQEAISNM